MKVVATYHAPASVLDSARCTLGNDADSEYLVVAKLNRVDFYSIQSQGLHHENGIDIWGRVRAVRPVPLRFKNLLSVLVLTDHPDPKLIFISLTVSRSGTVELTATKHLSLFERNSRTAEYFHDIVVDHSGAYAIASVYTARLRIILLDDKGQHKNDFDVPTTELNLLSLAFVGTNTLALLHVDFQQRLQLLAREISLDDAQLSPVHSPLLPPLVLPEAWFTIEENPPRIVFISADNTMKNDFNGGILIVGGRKILLYDLARSDAVEKNLNKARQTEKRWSADAEEESTAKQKGKETESNKRKARAVVNWPWSEVTAICPLDGSTKRLLIGDRFGRLAMLCVDSSGELPLTLIALGETSSPTTLTYLTNQVFYLGSHFGDSQLLRIRRRSSESDPMVPTLPVPPSVPTIEPAGLGTTGKRRANGTMDGFVVNGFGRYLEELESFHNLAPIVDAVLVDIDKTAQKEIVTCSGGRNTGCLKVIRRGADFREAAVIQGVRNVRKVWSLLEKYNDKEHIHLVVSAFERTHVFRVDECPDVDLPKLQCSPASFEASAPTLTLSNIMRRSRQGDSRSTYEDSSLVIQVVPHGLLLLEYDPNMRMFMRKGDIWAQFGETTAHDGLPEIVSADINASQVILALRNRTLLQLNLDGDGFRIQRRRQFSDEISAVSCAPLEDHKKYAMYFAVAFWRSDYVMILSAKSQVLTEVCKSPRLPAAPRSILLHAFSEGDEKIQKHPYILVGLVDGSVVSFVFRDQDKALVDMKSISIGTLPVSLHTAMIEGRNAVVACGSRASVLCWDKERLVHSSLMLKGVNAAVYLNTRAYPASMVIAGTNSLIIGSVTKFERVHIRSIPLGYDSPRCIVHCPPWKAFAVACTHMTPAQVGQAEPIVSSVQLFDEISFEKLSRLTVNNGEEVTSLHSLTVTLAGVPLSFVCVGVTAFDATEQEPSQGRIILLETSTDNKLAASKMLTITTTAQVKGCVYALASVDETIVAAVNSSLVLLRIEGTAKSTSLREMTTWNHNYLISTLVSRGDRLLVGDTITSVSLLKMVGSGVEMIARDYGSLWPTCAQMLDEKSLIGANNGYNLFAFRLEQTESQKVLEREGYYFLGDIVNKFLPGTLGPHEVSVGIPIEPKQLFFTSTGHIAIIADMNDELSLYMTALQRNMSSYYERKEGISHAMFRAPKNCWGGSDSEASSIGFLDGDFLERFLTVVGDNRVCHEIMEGQSDAERIPISPELIQKVLERLQSMH